MTCYAWSFTSTAFVGAATIRASGYQRRRYANQMIPVNTETATASSENVRIHVMPFSHSILRAGLSASGYPTARRTSQPCHQERQQALSSAISGKAAVLLQRCTDQHFCRRANPLAISKLAKLPGDQQIESYGSEEHEQGWTHISYNRLASGISCVLRYLSSAGNCAARDFQSRISAWLVARDTLLQPP